MAKILQFKASSKSSSSKSGIKKSPQEKERHRRLREAFDQLINQVLSGGDRSPDAQVAATLNSTIEFIELPEKIMIRFALPGFEKDQIKLFTGNGLLKLQIYQSQEEGGRPLFSQTLPLPHVIEFSLIKAKMEDDVLTVKLPRKETPLEKMIEIPLD